MAKKKQIPQTNTSQNRPPLSETKTLVVDNRVKGWVPYILIALFSIVLYFNTTSHEFALDDDIVICRNEYVLQGLSGIPDIFSKDLFDSFYKQMNTTAQLTGGRYRPLSVATFAIEQEIIGTRDDANFPPESYDTNLNGKIDPGEDVNGDGLLNDKDPRTKGFGLRHVVNIIFYALCGMAIFLFLSKVVFKQSILTAGIVTILFLAHPLHTEVVANVKSRDEILSLLCMMLSLYSAHQITPQNKISKTIYTCLFFLMALLSKEYGATLLVLIPLSLYVFNSKQSLLTYKSLWLGLLVTFSLYISMRAQVGPLFAKSDIQETEILNSPYLYAGGVEVIASKIFIFWKYLSLLLFPLHLSSDYGYASIPYKNFANIGVWLAIITTCVWVYMGFIGLKKRNWLAFAAAFYLLNLALVTNFIFNVGATMGERLIFHSSLGFCMIVGVGIVTLAEKMKQKNLVYIITIPILLFYSFQTIARNKAWKNDITLAITDVKINPNSTALNGNAATRYIDMSELPESKGKEKELLALSVQYGQKALRLHPTFVNGLLNLGLAYAKLEQFDSAKVQWDKAFQIYPHHPKKQIFYNSLAQTYYTKGYNFGAKQQWKEGVVYLKKAVACDSTNAKYWYDYGGFSYNAQDYSTAKMAWTKAFQLNPTDTNIQKVQQIIR